MIGVAGQAHAQEACPSDTASHRAGRYRATVAGDPAAYLDIEALEYCSTIEDGAVAEEIVWKLVAAPEMFSSPPALRLDDRDSSRTFDLPQSQGRWHPYRTVPAGGMSMSELIRALKTGRIVLMLSDPEQAGRYEPSPAERVYQTDWIPTFRERRPPRPEHCGPGTVAYRSLEVRAPQESRAAAYIRLGENDRPSRTVYTQYLKWNIRFEPALTERVTSVRLVVESGTGGRGVAFEFPPISAEYREYVPALYSEPTAGFPNWGEMAFRELFELLAPGRVFLEVQAADPEESFEVPLDVRLIDWRINCT